MNGGEPSDQRQLKLFVLELCDELHRIEQSIGQMQHRATELLGLLQQDVQSKSEKMYRDLERAIVEKEGERLAAPPRHSAAHGPGRGTTASTPPRLRAVPSVHVASKTMSRP